ncbi:unnamed protein product [Trichogramma brassicae]|uniref:Uncharacterized protein n=1 Tax=Trichogramma brassicae TaxID=86971 RepID=A0A6H5IDT5_9HYME|nr:unnamed protein product [Trichogramma brassicae]
MICLLGALARFRRRSHPLLVVNLATTNASVVTPTTRRPTRFSSRLWDFSTAWRPLPATLQTTTSASCNNPSTSSECQPSSTTSSSRCKGEYCGDCHALVRVTSAARSLRAAFFTDASRLAARCDVLDTLSVQPPT